jgi:hypothetical protein
MLGTTVMKYPLAQRPELRTQLSLQSKKRITLILFT